MEATEYTKGQTVVLARGTEAIVTKVYKTRLHVMVPDAAMTEQYGRPVGTGMTVAIDTVRPVAR